jgi:L-lactate dehydrogenase complex protein LldE
MKVGLFIPCYVNAIYPEAGVATYRLLQALGLDVDYPIKQTCCGQPMANGGFEGMAIPLAERFDAIFSEYEYVVGPSASCVAFVKENYPQLMKSSKHPCVVNRKIYEVCEFLCDILKVEQLPPARFPHKVSIHNSCHGVRELHLSSASEQHVPRFSKIRKLLSLVEGVEVCEPERADECCGFGGMFAIEEPAVSACMGRDKLQRHIATGAAYITGADSSCLMHLQGIARREKQSIGFIHIAQILSAYE